jgi:serine/threonine protein kinase
MKKLGKGAQGSVFLCEDKATHAKYVMKKVECSDEGEANKAFKEVSEIFLLLLLCVCVCVCASVGGCERKPTCVGTLYQSTLIGSFASLEGFLRRREHVMGG